MTTVTHLINNVGETVVRVGDEVENNDVRFFIGAINDSQRLCFIDKSKSWVLKNAASPMAAAIRQGNYGASAETLKAVESATLSATSAPSQLPPLPQSAVLHGRDLESLKCLYTAEQMRAYAQACIQASATSAASVPQGYVLVQIEPTEAMVFAGVEEDERLCDVTDIYRAMIAATPIQDAAPQEKREEDAAFGQHEKDQMYGK